MWILSIYSSEAWDGDESTVWGATEEFCKGLKEAATELREERR